ncbi:RNAi, RNA interference and gene silencing protein (Qde2) protein family [Histoplasma ohiense]|nr:RNAi, RNA interference and gene silencing protein (Qde2) protein family [Histoplasma ohiense (nom. inval.)]
MLTFKPSSQLIFVILPTVNTIYNHIKYLCDVKFGVHSFRAIASKFAKDRNHTYFANVALEAYRKLGGASHILDAHKLGFIPGCKTMVVCVDVTNPSPGSSTNASSGAAIVVSIDQNLTQWPAELCIQAAFQKMISMLDGELLKSRLKLGAKQHHRSVSPENVLIYHDAVMEGQ